MGMPVVSRVFGYCTRHFDELCRFGMVGIVTFGINFLAFSLFFGLMHAGYQVAISLAYLVTVCCHFFLNKIFTFGATAQKLRRNLPRYVAMLGLNYMIAIAASWLTVEVVGASPYWAVVTSTAGTALSSFFVMKYIVFGAPAVTSPGP
jgi:putative flippase GtrA